VGYGFSAVAGFFTKCSVSPSSLTNQKLIKEMLTVSGEGVLISKKLSLVDKALPVCRYLRLCLQGGLKFLHSNLEHSQE
jgi:hypothetical protein